MSMSEMLGENFYTKEHAIDYIKTYVGNIICTKTTVAGLSVTVQKYDGKVKELVDFLIFAAV